MREPASAKHAKYVVYHVGGTYVSNSPGMFLSRAGLSLSATAITKDGISSIVSGALELAPFFSARGSVGGSDKLEPPGY